MSYRNKVLKYASRSALFSSISSELVSCGWVLHDTITSGSDEVFKTQGEGDVHPPFYVRLTLGATYIDVQPYCFWDSTGNTGYCGAYMSTSSTYRRITISASTHWAYIGGSKDLFYIKDFASTATTSWAVFGFLTKPFLNDFTTTTAAATAGTNVSITVSDSSEFFVGYTLFFMDPTNRERWWSGSYKVNDIPDSTHIKIDTLEFDLASGSYILNYRPYFGAYMYNKRFYPVFSRASLTYQAEDGHVNNANVYDLIQPYGNVSHHTADPNAQEFEILLPYYFSENNWNMKDAAWSSNPGYSDVANEMFYTPKATFYDIFGIRDDRSKVTYLNATGGGSNYVQMTGAGWTTNEHVGKFVVITSGSGSVQARKISSNTSTQLNVGTNFFDSLVIANYPDATSIFVIVDKAYFNFTQSHCFKLLDL